MSMFFHRLKISGLLSFGPVGIDLPMEPLTVLIGPNGSGKSNLLEAISLLKAASLRISDRILSMGGVQECLWKGPEAPRSIALETIISYPPGGTLRHSLNLHRHGNRVRVADERIKPSRVHSDDKIGWSYFGPPRDAQPASEIAAADARAQPEPEKGRSVNWFPEMAATHRDGAVEFMSVPEPQESLLAQFATPEHPPLWHLKEQYRRIRFYRNWSFGPHANSHQPCSAHERSDFLDEGGRNLPLVLSQLHGKPKKAFLTALGQLFEGIADMQCPVTSGTVALFLEEAGGRLIPAARLPDGTLRCLCLLEILLHPEPPPLICIEEPELGLHPDLLPALSDLMREASKRTQLIVTTHSDMLVDTLTDQPESVVVCEKCDGQTEMRRLDKSALAKQLKDFRLGELWTSGELGGNRW